MEWKPIETAPKEDGVPLLLYPSDGEWSDELDAWVRWSDYGRYPVALAPQPTHWMRPGRPHQKQARLTNRPAIDTV